MCATPGGHIHFEKIRKFLVVWKFETCLCNIDAYLCNLEIKLRWNKLFCSWKSWIIGKRMFFGGASWWFCENQRWENFVLVSCPFNKACYFRLGFTWLDTMMDEYLASKKIVLASESHLLLSTQQGEKLVSSPDKVIQSLSIDLITIYSPFHSFYV